MNLPTSSQNKKLFFRQFFEKETSTFTYMLADSGSREAAIIDSTKETVDRDTQLIEELDLKPRWLLETHIHADHITGAAGLKSRFPDAKTAAYEIPGVPEPEQVIGADLMFKDNHIFDFGDLSLKVMATPGHTNSCVSYYCEEGGLVMTGDALLIRGCGRTDFQQGSNERLFKSVRENLFTLPEETHVYPGHDYKGRTCSSIEEEKRFNPRLNESMTLEEFSKIMDGLGLAPPAKIDQAVPANLRLGVE